MVRLSLSRRFFGFMFFVCVSSKETSNATAPTFRVRITENESAVQLPMDIILRIAYESLDVLNVDTMIPVLQFPFQSIICWGSNPSFFQFTAFPTVAGAVDKRKDSIRITMKTVQGRLIDTTLMSRIRKLMVDMEFRAVSKEEFDMLKKMILTESGELKVWSFASALL